MKKIFITGLAAIAPIVITVYAITALFSFTDGILGNILNKTLIKYLGYRVPGLGLVLFILVIFLAGFIIHISRRRIFRFLDETISSLPLAGKIYGPVKNIINFIFYPPKKEFNSAVLVQYPSRGIYSVGFITKESLPAFEEKTGKKLFNVFIATTPSPLSGFVILVPREDIVFLDIPVEEATKLIISGGLLNPYE